MISTEMIRLKLELIMADNPYKREICNMSISVLREGRRSDASLFFTSIDDTEFADWTTATGEDKQQVCLHYEITLLLCLKDMKPDFASHYADLGQEIRINKDFANWEYLFEKPSDYLDLIAQVSQNNRKKTFDCEALTFDSYAHVVKGSDDQAYYCDTAHTSVDDSSDGEPPDDDGSGNWTLYDEDGSLGAEWLAGKAYKASESGVLIAANEYSNDPSTTVDSSTYSAYIRYLAYVQAGISDKPQFYTPAFKEAFSVRLAAAVTNDEQKQILLMKRYELLSKPKLRSHQGAKRHIKRHITTFEARTR